MSSSSFFESLKHLIGLDKQVHFEPAIAYRNVKTGRYVSRQYAEKNPQTVKKEIY